MRIPVQAWLELPDQMATALFEIVNQTMKDKSAYLLIMHILSHAYEGQKRLLTYNAYPKSRLTDPMSSGCHSDKIATDPPPPRSLDILEVDSPSNGVFCRRMSVLHRA